MADESVDFTAKVAVVAAVVLALLGVAIDSGAVAWVLGPIVLTLALYAMTRVRLLYSLLGVMFISLTLENPNDAPAGGMWFSPLYILGALMMVHLNRMTGVSWLSVSGTDILLIFAIVIALLRRNSGSGIDGGRQVDSPKPLMWLAWLSLAGGAFVEARGLLRGGDFQKSLFQWERVTYLPILFMLFQFAIRSPADYLTIGRVFLTAAFARSLLAIYIMTLADVGPVLPPWATTHHDSMLFACAIVIIVSLVVHRTGSGAKKLLLYVAPIVMWAIVVNSRRTAWVQIPMVFGTVYLAMPNNPVKRRVRKLLIYTSPLSIAYVLVGWQVGTGIFKPVGSIRTAFEPAADVSTQTRDIENYCLAKTIGAYPMFGLGYGHTWFQIVQLPPMPHPLEPWLPHNSLLGLWFAAGFVGYTAITLLWTAGVYFGVRAYRAATAPMDRAVALVSFGSVLIYLIQCYADLGLGVTTAIYMVAPALAIAGQLAVSTGAWPARNAGSAARVRVGAATRR